MSNKRVVGISYDLSDDAPVVMLKAAGDDAAVVLDAAARDDIAVIRDAALVEQLYRVPMDAPVGRELFPVMAMLLAHVLQIDKVGKEEA
jgi:type III secretion system FlhB-like substrate exporter